MQFAPSPASPKLGSAPGRGGRGKRRPRTRPAGTRRGEVQGRADAQPRGPPRTPPVRKAGVPSSPARAPTPTPRDGLGPPGAGRGGRRRGLGSAPGPPIGGVGVRPGPGTARGANLGCGRAAGTAAARAARAAELGQVRRRPRRPVRRTCGRPARSGLRQRRPRRQEVLRRPRAPLTWTFSGLAQHRPRRGAGRAGEAPRAG